MRWKTCLQRAYLIVWVKFLFIIGHSGDFPHNSWYCIMYKLQKTQTPVNFQIQVQYKNTSLLSCFNNSNTESIQEILIGLPTFIIAGSFHGPLLDLRHPPSAEQEQEPPKKSGNWLKQERSILIIYSFYRKTWGMYNSWYTPWVNYFQELRQGFGLQNLHFRNWV